VKGTDCFHRIPDRCSYKIIRIVYKCEGEGSDDSTVDRRAETELEPRIMNNSCTSGEVVEETIKVRVTTDLLLNGASDAVSHTRLLAIATKESGAWLNALPVSSLGLRMDNDTICVAVGLRLDIPLCKPHVCCHCGAEVGHLATHGLSCRWSEGRH